MATTSTSPLSAGVQQLYNQGILPSSVSTSVLSQASPNQINRIAQLNIASQQASVLLGGSSAYTDSAALSTVATSSALLQEINPLSNSDATASDPLTDAVNNALLAQTNNAASQFLSSTTPATGTKINAVG